MTSHPVCCESLEAGQAKVDPRVLIKIGGSVLNTPESFSSVAKQLKELAQLGFEVTVIHGAGPSINARMKEEGLVPQYIDGLRVTDARVLEIVVESVDEVNSKLVAALSESGVPVNCANSSNPIFFCERKKTNSGAVLGWVGEILDVNPGSAGGSPALTKPVTVVAPLGYDNTGNLYNINADDAATKLCAALAFSSIFFASDVAGILSNRQDPDSIIGQLSLHGLDKLMGDGTISGGMIPKLNGIRDAIVSGASYACIFDGRVSGAIISAVTKAGGVNSVVTPQ